MGREGEVAPFVAWDDPEPFGIGYYGICTGWGATGSWLVEGKSLFFFLYFCFDFFLNVDLQLLMYSVTLHC